MIASRRARPRTTMGASSAGPVWRGVPTTKAPQRRHRHAFPAGVVADRLAARSDSVGA